MNGRWNGIKRIFYRQAGKELRHYVEKLAKKSGIKMKRNLLQSSSLQPSTGGSPGGYEIPRNNLLYQISDRPNLELVYQVGQAVANLYADYQPAFAALAQAVYRIT